MDITRLSNEEIRDFLKQHASPLSPERVELAFASLVAHRKPIRPSAILDLYIASRYSGPRDQRYSQDDILNLTENEIKAFEQVFNFNVKGSEIVTHEGTTKEKRKQILRILSYLELIDYDHNILLQPTILDEFCPLLSADDVIKFRQATYIRDLTCPVVINDKDRQIKTIGEIDDSSVPVIKQIEKSGSSHYFIKSSIDGDIDTVTYLLDNRADPNLKYNETTPLIAASSVVDNVELVKTLIEHKANPNLPGKDGITPLIVAADRGYEDTLKVLLNAKANIEASMTDEYGGTALIKASHQGHLNVVKELLAARANLEGVTEYQETALMLATSGGHVDVMRELIKAGADLEHRNLDDRTALMIAAFEDKVDSARVLLEAKANVNVQEDISGYTALMLATERNNPEVVKLLLKYGADPNINTGDEENPGITALEIAHIEHHQELIDLLTPITTFDPEMEERVRVLDEMKEEEEFYREDLERMEEEFEEEEEEFDTEDYDTEEDYF